MSKRQLAVDLVGLAGCASLVEGARRVHPAAAFLVAGALLLSFAILARSSP